MNERPVDVQSRGVTEPQRDAGSVADWGIVKKQISNYIFIIRIYPLRLVVPPRHLGWKGFSKFFSLPLEGNVPRNEADEVLKAENKEEI